MTNEKPEPCPFCGNNPEIFRQAEDMEPNCFCVNAKCKSEIIFPLEYWNNAWAHKRIAELQSEINNLKKAIVP